MFKAKRLIEKGGSSYLNQVPWSPKQTIPGHRLYLSIQLQKFLSGTYSRLLYMSSCAWEREREWVCVCVCVCEREREREREWMSQCVSVCVCVCVCEWMSQCVSVCVCVFWICSAEEYLELKVKHSGTGITHESVLYTTSNGRGFAVIKMLLKKIYYVIR